MQQMYNIQEACKILGCKPWKLYRLCKDKKIKHLKVGKQIMISERSLNEFIEYCEELSIRIY